MGPRTGMDDVEKRKFLILPEPELRLLVTSRYTDALFWIAENYVYILFVFSPTDLVKYIKNSVTVTIRHEVDSFFKKNSRQL
jgi:hypothetical protein